MSLYFRPITREDIKDLANGCQIVSAPNAIVSTINADDRDVTSKAVFYGRHTDTDRFSYPDQFTKVGYIDFGNIEMINPYLAGPNYSAWKIATGLRKNEVEAVVRYEKIYDTQLRELITAESVFDEKFDPERFLVGATCLKHFILQMDYEQELQNYIAVRYLKPLVKKLNEIFKNKSGYEQVTIEQLSENTFQPGIADIKYAQSSESNDLFYVNRDIVVDLGEFELSAEEATQVRDILDDLRWEDVSEGLDQFDPMQVYAGLISEGPEFLTKQILPGLFVLPLGYRPTLRDKLSGLSVAYNNIIRYASVAINTLRRSDNTVREVTRALFDLEDSIEFLMLGRGNNKNLNRYKNYKSLADEFKGKNGFVRDRLEGARTDFSGRTVITCDPDMPIDTIGIPIKMLEKIAEPLLVKGFRRESRNREDWHCPPNMSGFHNALDERVYGISYIDFLKYYFNTSDIYGIIGRQPTLFYLGMQGFKIKPVEGNAIVLSPLITPPFNADFDGDQMHFNIPATEAGVEDLKSKMLFRDNIRFPKNGAITVAVRLEIKYGLWSCLVAPSTGNSSGCKSKGDAFEAVKCQACRCGDNFNGITAGWAAFEYAIAGNNGDGHLERRDGNIHFVGRGVDKCIFTAVKGIKSDDLSEAIYEYQGNTTGFLSVMNKLVSLGFAVCRIFNPDISVIHDEPIKKLVDERIEKFNQRMTEYHRFVEIGLELPHKYSMEFDMEWSKLEKDIKGIIRESLGEWNGYKRMVTSGAKGDEGNLMQIYGIKGRVQKNDMEAFNTIIDGNYAGQLTGLEHFVTAYGSRKGIADKVLSTADPGYLSRKLEHAGAPLRITVPDCGTTETMDFMPQDVIPFISSKDLAPMGIRPKPGHEDEFYRDPLVQAQRRKAVDVLKAMLVGRNVVSDSGVVQIKNAKQAESYINNQWGVLDGNSGANTVIKPVRMRSPIYCSNPCCQVCYGKDLTKNEDKPRLKRNVGFIAAQAIGEPGTQMTMNNFHTGGVAGNANLTSAFDLIEDNFDLTDFANSNRRINGIMTYDPVSDVDGYVKRINIGSGKTRVVFTKNEYNVGTGSKDFIGRTDIVIDSSLRTKEYVKRGDSVLFEQGNLSVKELLRTRTYDGTIKYFVLNLYNIFKSVDVNLIHFECIAFNMTCCVVNYETNKYKVGDIVSLSELKEDTSGKLSMPALVGVKYLPKFRRDFLESIAMESATMYVPRAILNGGVDEMKNPILRTAFGLRG